MYRIAKPQSALINSNREFWS